MKKLAIFGATLLMLVPVLAIAGMTALNQADLSDVTGQSGITIDMEISLIDGYQAWGDDGIAAGYTSEAYVTMSGMQVSNGSGGAMSLTGLTIDAGTTSGGTSALIIGLPDISGEISQSAIKIGTAADAGDSLGSMTLGDISLAGSTIYIKAH